MIQNYNYFQSAREAPPAEGRPAGGVQGGRSPPGTIIQNYNYITIVFYNLKNLNNIHKINNLRELAWHTYVILV